MLIIIVLTTFEKKLLMRTLYSLLLLCAFSAHSQLSLPYTNGFNHPTSDENWTHYAIYGTDDWQRGFASGNAFNDDFSWETKLNGVPTINSSMALETPAFDLTNANLPYVISFKYRSNTNNGCRLYLEYSLDNGTTWVLLTTTSTLKKNWQNAAGFPMSYSGAVYNSAMDLSSLAGNTNVKFRFKFVTGTFTTNYGIVLDDFSIRQENYNVAATTGTPIEMSPLCSNLTVKTSLNFTNQYSNYFPIAIKYYLSTDTLIDAGDILLSEEVISINSSYPDLTRQFATPTGLAAGQYYVLYQFDATNVVNENNENDNVGYCSLLLNQVYNIPYSTDFETTDANWKPNQHPNATTPMIWEKGLGYRHHLEMAHSGTNAWHTSKTYLPHPASTNQWVESPYFNLSTATEPVYLSFWFKDNYKHQGDVFNLDYSTNCATTWTTLMIIPDNASDEWEHLNVLLNSTITSNSNVKFRITYLKGPQDPEGIIFDDFYIGPAKSDLSIERIYGNNRFTSTNSASDILHYEVHNSGMLDVANAVTKFYWSTDTTLDANDILLGEQLVFEQNSGVASYEEFSYTKPTTAAGNYYIIYQLDANNEVDELREYDNIGYFPIEQLPTIGFPYFNDFETEVTHWKHEATLGQDDWNYGTPNGLALNQAFSGTKAWMASTSSNAISTMSRMHLYTPAFDLSSSVNPVLEFDMKLENYGCYCSDLTLNLSYSIDNGATWMVLNPVNESYSKWYKILKYFEETGLDGDYDETVSDKMFDPTEYVLSNYKYYNSRDVDRNTKYIINIPQLANETNVRFRFNVSSELNSIPSQNLEGAIIDNFKISEATIDLGVPYAKNLLLSPLADKINFAIDVKNSGNGISNETAIKFYLSNNATYDSGDFLIGTSVLTAIKPDFKRYKSLEFALPNNLTDYSYLIYVIDDANMNTETDETNNTGAWNLGLNGVATFPYSEKFEEVTYDGWHGYSYDPYQTTTLANYRVVNRIPVNEEPYLERRLYNGVLMTEYVPYGSWQSYNTPQFYIQSPRFDFSNYTSTEPLTMVFDVMSIGAPYTNGTNMEYSLDGGTTWILISPNIAPNVNWYQNYQPMSEINDEPGWFGYSNEMITAKMNLDFLQNESDVLFRFKFYSNYAGSPDNARGFRLDNFAVGAESEVNLINCIEAVPNLMTFEEDFLGTCWETGVNTDEILLYDRNVIQDIHWQHATNFAGATNNGSLKIDLSGQGNTNGVWFISPKYNITELDTHLQFDIALNALGTTNASNLDADDVITLYSSIDNGLTWQELQSWNSNSTISNVSQQIDIADLPSSEFVRFAFWATNGTTNTNSNTTFYVDNFRLASGTLSTENFKEMKLIYFPNPVKNIFTISSQNETISKVVISNNIGQILETKTNINDTKHSIDFQSYPNGMYLVSVYTNENMKTIKVMKQ